ncbi:lipoprotein NlpI [Hartmannibacter diazotrophicus]|uniref:Lipoprotein NlpI n=1 Tax=Hartmannibacter diazotrophicus TaxID=1482074 RepID=A0A2C9D2M6_9HYPH|nr:tetratricopeptide repeat protein [Hartmannibacter diazotrophicus]SON54439.1 lipoprotein NlpI [Hartmannibacter diazotrophicus]
MAPKRRKQPVNNFANVVAGQAGSAVSPGNKQRLVQTLERALIDHKAGRLDAAKVGYEKALKVAPKHGDALHLLGLLVRRQGDTVRSLELITKAIEARPNVAPYYSSRGGVYADLEDFDLARADFLKAIEIDDQHPEFWLRLARIEARAENLREALNAVNKSLDLKADNAEAIQTKAHIFTLMKNYTKALEQYQAVQALRPDERKPLRDVIACMVLLKQNLEAIDVIEEALARYPDDLEFLNFLASCFVQLGLFEEARQVIEIIPLEKRDAAVLITDTLIDMAENRFEDAYRKMMPIHLADPDQDNIAWNLSLINLAMGNLEAGWDLYDRRLKVENIGVRVIKLPLPFWDGTPQPGAKLVIWSEQGVGDTIRMIALMRQVVPLVGSVTIACDARLTGLVKRSVPAVEAIPVDQLRTTFEDYDLQLSLGSLSTFFRRREEDFNIDPRYLVPDARRRLAFAQTAARLGPNLIVGICWRSRNTQGLRNHYYLDLKELAPIIATPGVSVINAQYNCQIPELEEFYNQTGLVVHSLPDLDQKQDIDGSVSLIDCCDLVITANTVVGDVAGGLGLPCWRFGGLQDAFLLGRDNPPWNPTTTFFPIYGERRPRDIIPELCHRLEAFRDSFDPSTQRVATILREAGDAPSAPAPGETFQIHADAPTLSWD